jgi:hypothetical protein
MSAKNSRASKATSKLPAIPAAGAPPIQWALWGAEVGRLLGAFKVFPCVPNEKRPLHEGWQDEAAWDRKTVESMWRNNPDCNIGLAVQPGFVVIDGDLYKPGAEAELERFETAHGRLPDTLEFKSARGGMHLIYSTAKTFGNGKGSLPDFGDVRGHGGLIVGPGSTFEGKRYRVTNLTMPVALPAHIEGMLREARRSSRDRRTDYGDPTERDTERARWLVEVVERGQRIKEYDGAFVEGERDNLTFQLFAEAKGRMIHPHTMLEAVLESGIAGGLEDDVVERKMDSAYFDGNCDDSYGRKVDAYWDANYTFKPRVNGKPVDRAPADPVQWKAANSNRLPTFFPGDPQPTPNATSNDRPEGLYRGLDDFATRPKLDPLIEDVIGSGTLSIASGRSKSGKSFCEYPIAYAIASKSPISWLPDRKIMRSGTALILCAEDQDRIVRDAKAYCRRNGIDYRRDLDRNLFILDHGVRINTDAGWAELLHTIDWIEATTGQKLVYIIVDTLRKNMQGSVSEEADVDAIMSRMGELNRRGIAVTLIAHHGREHGETKGLTDWEDGAHQVRHYTGSVQTGATEVTFSKIKNAADGWYVNVTYASQEIEGSTTKVAVPGDGQTKGENSKASIACHILAVLRSHPGKEFDIADLAHRIVEGTRLSKVSEDTLRLSVLGRHKGKAGWARESAPTNAYFRKGKWSVPSPLPTLPDDPFIQEKVERLKGTYGRWVAETEGRPS